MKKSFAFFFLFLLIQTPIIYADNAQVKTFHSEGEVTSVDPVYSRVTIQHAPIKGLTGDMETEFVVKSSDLLKKISRSDLVSFDIENNQGNYEIVKIEKTGVAPPKEEGVPLGQAAKDVFDGAGKVVQTVAAPIAPVSEAAGGAINSAGEAVSGTQPRVNDGNVESKAKF